MDSPRSQDDGQTEEAYLASYESSNRKRKMIIIAVAVIAILLVVGAFLGTIGSLGKMNEDVQGAFTEGAEGGEAPATDASGEAVPANAAPATNPPAESATPPPSEEAAAPTEAAPTPTEATPTPAP